MAGPRLLALKKQFDDLKEGIDKINRAAVDDGRDLTDAEQADHDALCDRAETLKPEIEKLAQREQSIQATADVLARIGGGTPTAINRAATPAELPKLSAGEFFTEWLQAHHPAGASAPDKFLERAARYIDRAQMATGDTGGILPDPIIGEVIKLSDSRRPVFNALTSRSMPPKGKTFQRPRITQRTTMGTQTEGQSLSSQKMTLTSDTVTKATQGGTLDITMQDIDWTEPEALQIVVQDFADMYVEWTEGLASDHLEGLVVAADAASDGDGYSAYTTTNVGTIVTSYVNGVVDVYDRCKRFPDTAFLDLASWATLTSTTNTNNDVTALEMVKRALAELYSEAGAAPGFRFVVGPQLAADTRIIAATSLIESYEQQKGLLRAELPSTLVVQLAYAGYTAFHGNFNAVVQLGTDPD